jgi:Fe-S-cluster containining protein
MAGGSESGARGNYNNGTEVIGLELDILGETLNFHISVGKGRTKLADIVPLARTLCDKITEVVVHRTLSDQCRIPCGKGCSACCSRYLVPLSIPEALRLKEEIDAAPAYQREPMLMACLQQARLILSHKPPKSLISPANNVSLQKSVDLNLVSDWYSNLNLACPFLYNHVCSIYEMRPLACREHYIIGSARACKGLRDDAQVLDMPIRLSNVLGKLASELEGTEVEAVILPLVTAWGEENSERTLRSWPSEMMLKLFAEIVEEMARNNLPAVT